ncbi:lachesin-like isoform X2 [Varroa jacobsoni]|uniref:lachesin-like isoform X2 n=1 Tax=Varroa jacobsoni TaxID=62625 RepID=UPI000BF77F5D|nr:lachesin-like isoform X2 [Varroa jacobsoni]
MAPTPRTTKGKGMAAIHQSTLLVLVISLQSVIRAVAQQQPTISHISQAKTVNIGDTVDLDCSVQYAYDFPVLWVKLHDDNPEKFMFISSGSTQIVPDQRFSIRHDATTSSYTLQVTKLQETDGGIYQCRVILSQTSILSHDVRLFIRVPPIISDNSTRSIITSTGANATLECYAKGQPKPRITWRRENNNLLPTGGSIYRGNVLHIFNVSKDDRGTYYCIADNQVGRGARRNIGVEVEFAPFVRAERSDYSQAAVARLCKRATCVAEGQEVILMEQNISLRCRPIHTVTYQSDSGYPAELACHVEAYPAPSIVWLKDGYQLNTNQHYKISISNTGYEFTDTTLRIHAIEKSQFGNYICRAINKLGSADRKMTLAESDSVVCPPACESQYLSATVRPKGSKYFIVSFQAVLLSLLTLLTRRNLY